MHHTGDSVALTLVQVGVLRRTETVRVQGCAPMSPRQAAFGFRPRSNPAFFRHFGQ